MPLSVSPDDPTGWGERAAAPRCQLPADLLLYPFGLTYRRRFLDGCAGRSFGLRSRKRKNGCKGGFAGLSDVRGPLLSSFGSDVAALPAVPCEFYSLA